MTEKLFGKEIKWKKGYNHPKQFGHTKRFPFEGSLSRINKYPDREIYRITIKINGQSTIFLQQEFEIKENPSKHTFSLQNICDYGNEKCKELMLDMKWWFE